MTEDGFGQCRIGGVGVYCKSLRPAVNINNLMLLVIMMMMMIVAMRNKKLYIASFIATLSHPKQVNDRLHFEEFRAAKRFCTSI